MGDGREDDEKKVRDFDDGECKRENAIMRYRT